MPVETYHNDSYVFGQPHLYGAIITELNSISKNVYHIHLQGINKSKGIPPNGYEFELLGRKFRVNGIVDFIISESTLPGVIMEVEEINIGDLNLN